MVLLGSLFALVPVGMWRQDRLTLVVGTAGLALLLLALVLTLVTALWVRLAVPTTGQIPLELRVGTPGRTGFVLTVPWWLPLTDLRWVTTAPRVDTEIVASGRQLAEQWTPHRRQNVQHTTRWFTVGDAFGLTGIQFPLREDRSVRFVPDEGALRQVQVIRGLASGDQFAHPEGRPQGDLQDIRAYGEGDPIRYVLWKVFAKSRTLVVRSPERAQSPIRRTAAYLVASEHDQAAAGTAKTAFECGALGDEWRFGADGTRDVAQEQRSALEVVMNSASGDTHQAGAGLSRFLAASDSPRRVVIFAPAVQGPWVERVLAAAKTTKLELILCADAVVPHSGRGLSALLLEDAAPPKAGEVRVARADLATLCKQLAGVGEIRVVDRRSGHVFGPAHLSKLMGAA